MYWAETHRDLNSFPTRRSSDLAVRSTSIALAPSGIDRKRSTTGPGSVRLLPSWLLISFSCARLGRRSEEHTSELQSRENLVCCLLLEKKHRTARLCHFILNSHL